MATEFSLLGLNRPEYQPARALFLSELAWSVAGHPKGEGLENGIAFADRGTKRTNGKKAPMYTRPAAGDPRYLAAAAKLAGRFRFANKGDEAAATAALLAEIEVASSDRSAKALATPLTLEIALLQDARGVTGKSNPANIALIFEQMYKLGGGEAGFAARWITALRGAESSGLPAWVTESTAELVPEAWRNSALRISCTDELPPSPANRAPRWLASTPNPYSWLARSWDNLCTGGWIDRMPRRRWTDWATCVARTGLAMGFAFEMHLARKLCAGLVSDLEPGELVTGVLGDATRILRWDDLLPMASADVIPAVTKLAAAGSASLALLADLARECDEAFPLPAWFDDEPDGLALWIAAARATAPATDLRRRVATALDAERSSRSNNVHETIRYSLRGRGTGPAEDLYGLLADAGRYSRVAPGQEWLVTVASLCAAGPGQVSRLADLQQALICLGIDASHGTLVSRLESYGLARGSHDADDAVEIMAGF